MPDYPIIPCQQREDWTEQVQAYAEALRQAAPTIGTHGLTTAEFIESGLFSSAIERLRGQRAASTSAKYAFIESVLAFLKLGSLIQDYSYAGGGERHDYEVEFSDGRICCIEAKGCLDGNNTNIFQRPAHADEFIIWSLCQNPGSNPRHNAWSGIHTRLSAEIISRRERVDGLVIWDPLCGTPARPCPKAAETPPRVTGLNGKNVPPPCIYTFPRTIPDPRNNPAPRPWEVTDIRLLDVLAAAFHTAVPEVVHVGIEARMDGANTQRRTLYTAGGTLLHESGWTTIRRAN